MSNRRQDRPVPEGFTRYDGNYKKVFYTVLTFNGVYYTQCWPNAGTFHSMERGGQRLEGNDVFAIKEEPRNEK